MEVLISSLKAAAAAATLGVIRQSEGVVLSVGDGIAAISGLHDAGLYEFLEFPGGVRGIAFDLEPRVINVVLLDRAEGVATRDNTERMLRARGVGVRSLSDGEGGAVIEIEGGTTVQAMEERVRATRPRPPSGSSPA